MVRTRCETDRLLEWLGEVVRSSENVDVDIVVVDKPRANSSLQLTIHDVPGPLAGLRMIESPSLHFRHVGDGYGGFSLDGGPPP